MNYSLILAAGQGKRMNVDTCKCAHKILRKPMAKYVFDAINKDFFKSNYIVVEPKSLDTFNKIFSDSINYVIQESPNGTGGAILEFRKKVKDNKGYTLILPGDTPLLNKEEIEKCINFHKENKNDVTIITCIFKDPTNYGRVIRDNDNRIIFVKPPKELSIDDYNINEVNTGVYVVNNSCIDRLLELASESRVDKINLHDIVEKARLAGYKLGNYSSKNEEFYLDVNDFYTLSIAEKIIRDKKNKELMLQGVNIVAPETVIISDDVIIEAGATINPSCYITGKSIIKKGAIVGPNSEIDNSIINSGAHIKQSLIKDSIVGENTIVGPFAHLRDNAIVGKDLRIGNFVEIKKSNIDDGTKISHLTYIGDTSCGKNVNWGCGCVTVNYDGKNKNKTLVGDNCFIGCNTNLIAPVSVGKNAFIAAGSTITDDVPEEAFSIARERQVTKQDYATRYEYYKKYNKEGK